MARGQENKIATMFVRCLFGNKKAFFKTRIVTNNNLRKLTTKKIFG